MLTCAWHHAQVFVLLFGVGEAETEGIYSLRAMSREEGLPQDTIVAFEDLEDAERCALPAVAASVVCLRTLEEGLPRTPSWRLRTWRTPSAVPAAPAPVVQLMHPSTARLTRLCRLRIGALSSCHLPGFQQLAWQVLCVKAWLETVRSDRCHSTGSPKRPYRH